MRCVEARRDMYAFLDGAVSVERNLEVLQHLNCCAACSKRFEAERRFEEGLVRTLRGEPEPPGLRGRLAAALDRAEADAAAAEREGGRPAAGSPRGRILRIGLAAAAAAAVAVLVLDYTCVGPFQCPILRAAVGVADRVDRGETPYCLLCDDPADAGRAVAAAGRGAFLPPDLSLAGFEVVGAASAVPADPLEGTGALCGYRSRFAGVAFVEIPVGDHDPKGWNRVEAEGRAWWMADHRGWRVLGWKEGGRFRALVTESPRVDLMALGRMARR